MISNPNKHMEHLEDSVINNGVIGARDSIKFLQSLRNMLNGDSNTAVNTTVKWDGAPAVIVGRKEGKLFVATKSYFSKNSKYYQSVDEINNADIPEDLKYKLNACLYYLKDLKTDVILQGDLLFTHNDLRTEVIEGENMVVFHPNTIVYAVPRKSELGNTICKSTLGIVWHTVYSDDGASYDFNINMINQIKDVFMIDANYQDVSGTATFTKDESKEVTKILSDAGKVFKKIDSKLLNNIALDKHCVSMIKIHYNLMVRNGKTVTDSRKHVHSLQRFLKERVAKEIDALKTDKGKEKKEDTLANVLFLASCSPMKLQPIFELQKLLVDAKLLIIKKLNNAAKLKTFLKTSNGYKLTGEEGYVAVSNGNAVKLVDRLEFSYANFSDDIIKGWDNDTRN
jgi:hypothetical protein|tara:strand:- start:7883 stop:9073 length:1191 start_codon:yes stop_codon:yes gene_type:complete